jgi:hypothetical protein
LIYLYKESQLALYLRADTGFCGFESRIKDTIIIHKDSLIANSDKRYSLMVAEKNIEIQRIKLEKNRLVKQKNIIIALISAVLGISLLF